MKNASSPYGTLSSWKQSLKVFASYIIGESRENAANGRAYEPPPDRAEFLAGIDLILAGIAASGGAS